MCVLGERTTIIVVSCCSEIVYTQNESKQDHRDSVLTVCFCFSNASIAALSGQLHIMVGVIK